MLKDFRIGILLFVLAIVGLSNMLAFSVLRTNWLVIPIVLILLLVLLSLMCYRYVSRTNRELARFFFALRHHDFSLRPAESELGAGFKELQYEMEQLLQVSADIKLSRESHFQLLQAILNEMPSGVLLVRENGEIVLSNRAFLSHVQSTMCKNLVQLEEHIIGISTILNEVQHGRQSFTIQVDGETQQLLASYTKLIVEEELELYVIHSASSSFENTELEAWNKLIRILTHEIMNSVASISSLSSTGIEIIEEQNQQENLQKALKAIQRRSNGLLSFVERYRRFTNVAAPQKQWLNIQEELLAIQQLMDADLNGIEVTLEGDSSLTIYADKAQLQQVVLNGILNACHALETVQQPSISIKWLAEGNMKKILIRDNGIGIAPAQLNDVFIPFFTTRKSGSGIGLSLVRQIMQKHNGGASIFSEKNKFTELSLRFPDN